MKESTVHRKGRGQSPLPKERRRNMSWRNHKTHAEETKAVKAALATAGIKATVGHGSGTAWAWLEINLGPGNWHLRQEAIRIAKVITGRTGDYDGDIMVLAQ